MNLLSGYLIGFKDIKAVIFQTDYKRQLFAGAGNNIQRAQARLNSINAI